MSGIIVGNHIEHSLFGITHHLLASSKAISASGSGKEQSHIVVDFGSCAYRRTGILVGGFLLDTDDGRETCNLVDIRALHTAKEVAGIGRERLDISALTLGKNRVESQRRLAAATQSRNHRERIAGNLYINILKVVYASTVHIYLFVFSIHFLTFSLSHFSLCV